MDRSFADRPAGAARSLARLQALGQSVWLDYLRRDFLQQGGLRALIERDGVRGLTLNATTFMQSIAWTGQYDATIAEWVRRGETHATHLYERLVVADVQSAADQLRDVYAHSDRRDGYVTLAIAPELANDEAGLLAEAARWWRLVERPNLMLEFTATEAGIRALAEVTAAGRSACAGQVCGLEHHAAVVEAYLAGLERRDGEHDGICSLAGLVVDRLDEAADQRLAAAGRQGGQLALYGGTVAVATARLAYQQWKKLHSGRRWMGLAAKGARPQRLLFSGIAGGPGGAPDPWFAPALVGRDTVSAMSIPTLDAFRARSEVEPTLDRDIPRALEVLRAAATTLDLPALYAEVLEQGVARLSADFLTLRHALERKRDQVLLGLPPLNPPRGET